MQCTDIFANEQELQKRNYSVIHSFLKELIDYEVNFTPWSNPRVQRRKLIVFRLQNAFDFHRDSLISW